MTAEIADNRISLSAAKRIRLAIIDQRVKIRTKTMGTAVIQKFFFFSTRYTVTTASARAASSWLRDPKRGHRIRAPLAAGLEKASTAARATTIKVAT